MKNIILVLFAVCAIAACDNDNYSNSNKYLPNYNFSIDIDTNLPLYNSLQFTANPVKITQAGIGINGIIVMNTGNGYSAYEASCPNQEITSCSELTIDGINAVCPCDNVSYSLFTGLPDADVHYPLKPYRVERLSDTVIRVYN